MWPMGCELGCRWPGYAIAYEARRSWKQCKLFLDKCTGRTVAAKASNEITGRTAPPSVINLNWNAHQQEYIGRDCTLHSPHSN